MSGEKIVIRGKIPSKANRYRIITKNGHSALAKSDATREYEEKFMYQCSLRDRMIERPFKLDVDVYFQSNQPDLDNSFKVLLDCLQACKAIKNDRYCVEIHGRKLIDKVDPRIEFTIEEAM